MTEVTKLIEQWCGEDKDSARGFIELFNYDKKQAKSWTRFVEFLATRPTCGQEQRKFLDEVEKHGKLITAHGITKIYHNGSVMYDSEFDNLDKVIKGE